ncbi:FecR family protein [Nibrella viscosa]|uniref:FecR family protein n=1 Tax=Nibrella viscosa TaxID=1084524 RepID=A0ABP8KB78_9BACT
MTVTKELLRTYFSGQATPFQKQMIADWLKQPANQELYFDWLEEWERRVPQYAPDVDTAVDRFRQRLDGQHLPASAPEQVSDSGQRMPGRQFWSRMWWVAAGTVLIVGLLGYIAQDYIWYKTYATDYGQTYALVLPDGSAVTLNGHSSLWVPRFGFGESLRRVRLSGEAVFDVKHTVSSQRFVVHTLNNLDVEVLGTEFSVNTRPYGTQVALNRGKVKLHYQDTDRQERQLVMKPGDWIAVDEQGALKRGSHKDAKQFAAWREQRFEFDNTPLQEVITMLNETYGYTIKLADDKLATRTLTGTFRARTPEDLLEALAQLLDLRMERQNKTIVLSTPVTNL